MNREEILAAAEESAGYVQTARRMLHQIPELMFEEHETCAYIRKSLDAMGLAWREAGTGTLVDIGPQTGAPRIALRADIDALPIGEDTGLPYASRHPGRMHACGHDAHTAMLLTAARILAMHRSELPGPVRLIFQPAEEGGGGALRMMEAGALQDVSRIYCLHMGPGLDAGKFKGKGGVVNASSNAITIRVSGKSTHGANPESGVDALVIASHVVLALQALISRETGAMDSAVLTIGTIQGGTARNILCGEVTMEATLRTLNEQTRQRLLSRICEVCEGIACAYRGSARVEWNQGYCVGNNDEAAAQDAFATVRALFGPDAMVKQYNPSMGSEDFSFYSREIPGVKMALGTGFKEGLHTPHFRLDESTLPCGVAYFLALAFRL